MRRILLGILGIILLLGVIGNVNAEEITCTDSDGGDNIYVKGTCTDNQGSQPHEDRCFDEYIYEGRCSKYGCEVIANRKCPEGYTCSDGACVEEKCNPQNIAPLGAVSSNKKITVGGADAINDGNHDTYGTIYFSKSGWIQVDLGEEVLINKVKWPSPGTSYPKDYKIQVSSDGIAWTDVVDKTEQKSGAVEHTFDAMPTNYIRLYATESGNIVDGNYLLTLFEFEVYTPSVCPKGYVCQDGKCIQVTTTECEESFLYVGDSIIANGKVVTLEDVSQERQRVTVNVYGSIADVIGEDTVNGVKIKVHQSFYSDTFEERSAELCVYGGIKECNERFFIVGDFVVVDGKIVVLNNVGSELENTLVNIDIGGILNTVSGTEVVEDIGIGVVETFYSDTLKERGATLCLYGEVADCVCSSTEDSTFAPLTNKVSFRTAGIGIVVAIIIVLAIFLGRGKLSAGFSKKRK